MDKWSAECEALRANLKAAAASNAEQEQSIEVLKVKAAKKGEFFKNMEKINDQLRPELEQLEHYNQYLANESRKKVFPIDRPKSTLKNKGQGEMFIRESEKKHFETACNAIRDFVGKKFRFN